MSSRPERLLILCVSSASGNKQRRRAIRRSWFTFKTSLNPWLTPEQQQSVELCFVVSRAGSSDVAAEQEEHGDMLLLDAPEGYENLWRKALASLQHLEQRFRYAYYMHADDDSYVRLDLVLQLLSESPSSRFYWGYVWDGTGNRCTAPIRNPRNKSHMPREQVPSMRARHRQHHQQQQRRRPRQQQLSAEECAAPRSTAGADALVGAPPGSSPSTDSHPPLLPLLPSALSALGCAPLAALAAALAAVRAGLLPALCLRVRLCAVPRPCGRPAEAAPARLQAAGPSLWHPPVRRRLLRPAGRAGAAGARRARAALQGPPNLPGGHHRAALPGSGGDGAVPPAGAGVFDTRQQRQQWGAA